jgi:hypothetical protein
MPNLFPTFDVPGLNTGDEQNSVQYPPGWLFDFQKGDFVTDGAGRMVMADGLTTWAQWCIKAVMTQRFAHLIYSTDYGCEHGQVRKQPSRAAALSEVERTISETLLVDPRTQSVKDFNFSWKGDELVTAFTVVPVIGDPRRLEVNMN